MVREKINKLQNQGPSTYGNPPKSS